jgi:lipopolysaccharide biosynthesis protein
MKVAFVVHLYYIEMLDELCRCLDELHRHMDYHADDLKTARELWTKGAEFGNEQCKINLETFQ